MKKLALFDLDNTLLEGDSDYEWAQFLIEEGVLHADEYNAKNDWFYERYKDGTLDIHEFLDFQLKPIARRPREQLDAWHSAFMQRRIRPIEIGGWYARRNGPRDQRVRRRGHAGLKWPVG